MSKQSHKIARLYIANCADSLLLLVVTALYLNHGEFIVGDKVMQISGVVRYETLFRLFAAYVYTVRCRLNDMPH